MSKITFKQKKTGFMEYDYWETTHSKVVEWPQNHDLHNRDHMASDHFFKLKFHNLGLYDVLIYNLTVIWCFLCMRHCSYPSLTFKFSSQQSWDKNYYKPNFADEETNV